MKTTRRKRVEVINEILELTLTTTTNANQEQLEPLRTGWKHILASRGWS